jgi:SsrA-binding protein
LIAIIIPPEIRHSSRKVMIASQYLSNLLDIIISLSQYLYIILGDSGRILAYMENSKTITVNRKAYHDYHILESLESGIVLKGTEIKSIREGRVNIRDAYAKPERGELWLLNAHIASYQAGSHFNHDPGRARKLLLHRSQIDYLSGLISRKGLTLVPLKLYIKKGVAKLEVGVARGKRAYDKRDAIARREAEREMERSLKRRG